MKRVIPIAAVFAAGALAFSLRTGSAAPTPSAPALDDATIVAIFDAANTADIETGELGAKKGSTKTIRDFGAMLARDLAPAFVAHRDAAKNLLTK